MGSLVEELLDAGYKVQWLVAPIDSDHPEVSRLGKMGARVEKLPLPLPNYVRLKAIRQKLHGLLSGERPIRAKISSFDPDHIFVNQGGTWCGLQPEVFEVLQARKGRYSLICHLGKPGALPNNKVQEAAQMLMTNANSVFFPSKWVRQIAEEQNNKRIPNASFFHYPHRFSFNGPLAWPKTSSIKIALVSRIDSDHKGIDLALEALEHLQREGAEFVFTLYGSGPDEEKLRRMVENLGLQGKVVFAGYAEDVENVWRENEMLLLPSRREGCAVAMTEAMGFGRPVIATAVGGAPDWIEDGKEGFLCGAADVGQLTQTLSRALQERVRWQEMGEAAHRKIKERLPAHPARVFLESLA